MIRRLATVLMFAFSQPVWADEIGSIQLNEASCLESLFFGLDVGGFEQCDPHLRNVVSETTNEALRGLIISSARRKHLKIGFDKTDGTFSRFHCQIRSIKGLIFDDAPCQRSIRQASTGGYVIEFFWDTGRSTLVKSRNEQVSGAFLIDDNKAQFAPILEGGDGSADCSFTTQKKWIFCFVDTNLEIQRSGSSRSLEFARLKEQGAEGVQLTGSNWMHSDITFRLSFAVEEVAVKSTSRANHTIDRVERYELGSDDITFKVPNIIGYTPNRCNIHFAGGAMHLSRCADGERNGVYRKLKSSP